MTKEEYLNFCLRYRGCGACFPLYEKLNRFEKMWFTAIQQDVAELENKIADIKANCDYVLEGKEIKHREERKKLCDDFENMKATLESKIEELEKENERLKGDLELWESGGCRATNLFECGVVKELKEQIEKMKRHCNCKHRDSEGYCEVKRTYLMDLSYDGCDKWELED